MAAITGRKGKREAYDSKRAAATAATISKHSAIFAVVLSLLLLLPVSEGSLWNRGPKITVSVQNNHTNYLSIRCFSFESSEKVRHLDAGEQFSFTFATNSLFPSATMVNCSTNMGVFVAYRFDYHCKKVRKCEWKFDLNQSYLLEPSASNWAPTWIPMDYNPNYESLERGGVVEAKYTN
ncbi:hypothetical protein ACET3Z_014201 [Daucus carota]|nr:PREDICTED: uncharacterized protein LOC108218243 [Daucus carota subsp. sativus]